MAALDYPLAEVIKVKIRRVEEAEKVLKQKREALEKEQKILEEKKAERDKAVDHHKAKLAQLRSELDHGTTSDKVQQMKAYLKVTFSLVEEEEKKVKAQEQQVEIAERNIEQAKQEVDRKRLEVDKLNTHKIDWLKAMRKEIEIIEGREEDEVGSIIFNVRSRMNKAK